MLGKCTTDDIVEFVAFSEHSQLRTSVPSAGKHALNSKYSRSSTALMVSVSKHLHCSNSARKRGSEETILGHA